MPKIITDADGNEIEVLTPEEIDAQKTAAVAEAGKKVQTEYEAKVREIQGQLEVEKAKERDFVKLRELKDRGDEELKGLKEKYEKEVTALQNKEIVDYKSQLFTALAGKDEELQKKIEFHFGQFKNAETADKTQIDQLANDALKLAMGETGSHLTRDVLKTGGGAPLKPGEIPSHLIPHAKSMGMNDAEFAKYYQQGKEKGLIKD